MTPKLTAGVTPVTAAGSGSTTSPVECDEVYVVAGHKGNPVAVKKKVGSADAGD